MIPLRSPELGCSLTGVSADPAAPPMVPSGVVGKTGYRLRTQVVLSPFVRHRLLNVRTLSAREAVSGHARWRGDWLFRWEGHKWN